MVACMLFFYPLLGMVLFRHPNAAAAILLSDEVCEQEAMLLVSPAGVLHAVNPVTKHTIWTFASGVDMGSKFPRTDRLDISSSGEDSNNQTVYFGTNGKLYVVEGSQVRATAMKLRDLIADTPRVTADGKLIRSSLSKMVFVLDKDTGALVRNFNNFGYVWGKPEATLFCRRTDYSVIVQDVATGALHWKVSVADIRIMRPRSYDQVPIALFSSKGETLQFSVAYAFSPSLGTLLLLCSNFVKFMKYELARLVQVNS